MSETSTSTHLTSEGSGGKPHHDGSHGEHPGEGQYIKIALILAVLTAIEVGLYYTKFEQGLTNAILLALAAFKFAFVVLYFMHLKFDNRIVRRLFVAGFVLAVGIYIPMLGMFQALTGDLVVTTFAMIAAAGIAALVVPVFARRS